jgi:predicted RNA-binding protein with PUA-like domain
MACGIGCWELMVDSRTCVWIVCDLTGVRSHEAKKIMKEKMKLGDKVRTFLFSCLSQNKPFGA